MSALSCAMGPGMMPISSARIRLAEGSALTETACSTSCGWGSVSLVSAPLSLAASGLTSSNGMYVLRRGLARASMIAMARRTRRVSLGHSPYRSLGACNSKTDFVG
jgi:hypothetical protein